MSNFFEQIENEYSRARGKLSRLAPLDWQLADEWQKKEIPLSVILGAMHDVAKNFRDKNRIGTINTLRYFAPEVEKRFAAWLETQVGKNTEEKTMTQTASQFSQNDENIVILDKLVSELTPEHFTRRGISLPEDLAKAVAQVRSEILALMSEINTKQPSLDEIDGKLEAIACDFNLALISGFSDEQTSEMVREIKAEQRFTLTEELLQKMLTRKMRQKYGLPEITLFAF